MFRDELKNLLAFDQDAKRLSQQTFLISEFLHEKVPGYVPPPLHRKAVVHGHCHEISILKFDAATEIYKKMGLEFDDLKSGCCGMAGAFGFEKDHYDVSIACGERSLLPAARQADESTLVITIGFSCHEQVLQTTGKRALHFAEVLKMALDEKNTPAARPERELVPS